jgi:hypothetical protein
MATYTIHQMVKLFAVRELPEGYGWCGNDTQPCAGDAQICCERYTLITCDEDQLDDDGFPAERIDGLEIEPLAWEPGDTDEDGTARLTCVGPDAYCSAC